MREMKDELVLEEFRQLHEHLRVYENGMLTAFTVSVVAYGSLLAATFGYLFGPDRQSSGNLTVSACYVLLAPAVLVILSLKVLTAYRNDIFRFAFYLQVFFEERLGGTTWQTALTAYRRKGSTETGTPFVLTLWVLLCISLLAFAYAVLTVESAYASRHLVVILAPIAAMYLEHCRFTQDRVGMRDHWRAVRDEI